MTVKQSGKQIYTTAQTQGRLAVFMPKNDHRIREDWYDRHGIVQLLRRHKRNPEAIQFIADMLE